MKGNDWILIGAIGIGAYLLYKSGVLGGFEAFAGGGGGGYTQDTMGINTGQTSNASEGQTPIVGSPGGFGSPGQPSVNFAVRTMYEATLPGAPQNVRLAASAIRAGAPPRMVAKIKAGHAVLDGGKY